MITALIVACLVVYGLCALMCARLVAGALAWRMNERYRDHRKPNRVPDGEQWFGGWVVGLLAGFVWPMTIVFWAIPFERLAMGEERRQIQRRQAERIANLEEELGIGREGR